MTEMPTVTVVVLAKQKAAVLPLYLECLEGQDYPKDRIHLYVRTNDSSDSTEQMLEAYIERLGSQYLSVHYDNSSIDPELTKLGVHDWENRKRFTILNRLREESVRYAVDNGSDFYFIADCDNWIVPWTLRCLIEANVPVIAPFLRHNDDGRRTYSNYHHRVDADGWFLQDPGYDAIWNQTVRGLIECECVHCTYLVRKDVLPQVYYEDPDYPHRGNRYDYVVFSEAMRLAGIPQVFDNREVYGWLSLDEQVLDARALIRARIADAPHERDLPSFKAFIAKHGRGSISQSHQDLYVLWRLREQTGGVFVEIGASNGVLSNTLLLERDYNWRGLLVEPNPRWLKELFDNRTYCHIDTRAAWSSTGHELEFLDATEPELGTVALCNHDKWQHLRDKAPTISVTSVSLNDLFVKWGIERIDYLSIDTEGSEFVILEALDWGRWRPRVITVEHNHHELSRALLHNLLTAHGYRREFMELSAQDDWYVLETP